MVELIVVHTSAVKAPEIVRVGVPITTHKFVYTFPQDIRRKKKDQETAR